LLNDSEGETCSGGKRTLSFCGGQARKRATYEGLNKERSVMMKKKKPR
jgi:hypothetical protein